MDDQELRDVFDRMASGYDSKSDKIAPIYNGLYFLLGSVFADLPHDARLLCVGAGTGTEVLHLASVFPGWRFTAVEPSGAMLDICRKRIEQAGISSRCHLHRGYLDSPPGDELYDGATCFLVSQFIMEARARSDFFRQLSARLVPGGILANADLSFDTESEGYDALLAVWQWATTRSADSADREHMKSGYARDVSILPSREVMSSIESAGFNRPVPFFQAAPSELGSRNVQKQRRVLCHAALRCRGLLGEACAMGALRDKAAHDAVLDKVPDLPSSEGDDG